MADKYDDLFGFCIKLYDDEIARFRGVDTKIARYLSAADNFDDLFVAIPGRTKKPDISRYNQVEAVCLLPLTEQRLPFAQMDQSSRVNNPL